jgi:hypothetical protein
MSTNLDLTEARAVLERTPATLSALLRGLPAPWTNEREKADAWSPHEVLAHLINAERSDWIPRAKLILAGNPAAVFTPFDREGFFAEAQDLSSDDLLDLFAKHRQESLATLASWRIGERELQMTATHPAFGPASLAQLLSTWVAHDLGHIVQISRTMARRYRTDVGPWRAYLSVLG